LPFDGYVAFANLIRRNDLGPDRGDERFDCPRKVLACVTHDVVVTSTSTRTAPSSIAERTIEPMAVATLAVSPSTIDPKGPIVTSSPWDSIAWIPART
jgi:hypothetical protein